MTYYDEDEILKAMLDVDNKTDDEKGEEEAELVFLNKIETAMKMKKNTKKKKTKPKGGHHEHATQWTPLETGALADIMTGVNEEAKVRWKDIAVLLREQGFGERSSCSVRNHWRRRRVAREKIEAGRGRNKCTVCGLYKAGHVCPLRRLSLNEILRLELP